MPRIEKIEDRIIKGYVPGMEKLPDDPDGLIMELQNLEHTISPEQKRTRENLKILAHYLKLELEKNETRIRRNTVNHIHNIIRSVKTAPAQIDESIDRQFTTVFNELDIEKAVNKHLEPNLKIINEHYNNFKEQVKANVQNPAGQEKMLQNIKLIQQKIEELSKALQYSDCDLVEANEVIHNAGNRATACLGFFKKISEGKYKENTFNTFNIESSKFINYLDKILTDSDYLRDQLTEH